jgi:O-Antigen ligase
MRPTLPQATDGAVATLGASVAVSTERSPRSLPQATPVARVPWGSAAAAVAVGAVVFWLGVNGGTYGLSGRGSFAVALWWGVLLLAALGLAVRQSVGTAALVVGGLLAAFAAWTAASIAWAASNENAFVEVDRVCMYLGVFVLVVLLSSRVPRWAWADGAALGLTAVTLVGLASRLFPGHFSAPTTNQVLRVTRLSYPVNYWNALATVAALAVPLLLARSTRPGASVIRAAALAPIPALAASMYLTSSRGGIAAAVLGAIVFVVATPRRWAAAAALVLGGGGSALAIWVLRSRPALLDGPLRSSLAVSEGRSAAYAIAAVCLVTGAAWGIATRLPARSPQLPRAAKLALAALAVAAGAIALVAAHPRQRFEDFKRVPNPAESATVASHLALTSGNGRWQLWQSAYDEFQAHPVRGGGAGSFEAWWAQHGSLPSFVLDAHSLYLETLGELGVIGAALLVACLLVGLATGIARLRGSPSSRRVTDAALLASFAAFAFEAGVDWMWEVTAVGAVGVAWLALLVAPRQGTVATRPATPVLLRLAVVVVCLAVVVGEALPALATVALRDSQRAADRGDLVGAVDDAKRARSLEPWAASPFVQLALVAEQAGDLRGAEAAVRGALRRDRTDWRTWLIGARVETKLGHIRAARSMVDRVRELDPHSPLFSQRS